MENKNLQEVVMALSPGDDTGGGGTGIDTGGGDGNNGGDGKKCN